MTDEVEEFLSAWHRVVAAKDREALLGLEPERRSRAVALQPDRQGLHRGLALHDGRAHRLLVLLRCNDSHALAGAERPDQNFVGYDVQFLLLLSLNVVSADLPEYVFESSAANVICDDLCGDRERGQNPR